MFKVNIYIETDLTGVKKQYRGYGAVVEFILHNGEPETREAYGLLEATGNQIMLIALNEALKHLGKPCEITVYMDNKYVSENIRNGKMYEWRDNNWKTVRNEPIANMKEWQELIGLIGKHRVTFMSVKHHPYTNYIQNELKTMKNNGERWEQQRLSEEKDYENNISSKL